MPQLIKNIQAEIIDNPIGDIELFNTLVGQTQEGDYINISGIVAFLQNFSKVIYSENISKPIGFGLKNRNNIIMITLEIDY